ncbi:MAG: hypothetical protein AB7L09_01910 [Nitrospira sp.]
MSDHQVISMLHAFKVSRKEWAADYTPSQRELSAELRKMGRLDVAARVESRQTVWALRD